MPCITPNKYANRPTARYSDYADISLDDFLRGDRNTRVVGPGHFLNRASPFSRLKQNFGTYNKIGNSEQ